MSSDKFRQQLRQEVEKWQKEGIISQFQYEQLAELYRFNSLEPLSFVVILMGLGSILLGLGAITFVAANWQIMSRELRAGLLIAALIGSNWLGFHLWQRSRRWQVMGRALLILGAFIMGANIALIAQMFHVDGELYGLFFTWGFGVLAMSYGLRFKPLGVFAIILVGLGYWNHFYNSWRLSEQSLAIMFLSEQILAIVAFLFVPLSYWCRSRSIGILAIILMGLIYWNHLINPALSEKHFLIWAIVQYMPIVSVSLFLPLAYWCRSRSVFMFSIALILGGLSRSIVALNSFQIPSYIVVAIALTLPPALLWIYDDALYFSFRSSRFQNPLNIKLDLESESQNRNEVSAKRDFFVQPVAHSIALILLSIICYFQSFYWAWSWRAQEIGFTNAARWAEPTSFVNVILFTTVALLSWYRLLFSPQQSEQSEPARRSLTTKVVGALLVILASVIIWHGAVSPIPEIATFIYNILLFLMAAGLIRESLDKSQRLSFWSGIGLISLQIISRLFEYETGLLLKSFVFVLCGVGVIAAGLWFERYLSIAADSASLDNLSSSTEKTV